MHHILALTFAALATAATGCIADQPTSTDEDHAELAVRPDTAFTLTVTDPWELFPTAQGNGQLWCFGAGTCSIPAGTPLTITLNSRTNPRNCAHWTGWASACAGQGVPCLVTINSNLSLGYTVAFTEPGCRPGF